MCTRDNVKVGANIQHLDTMSEQGDAAKTTIISRIAVFKGKNALQANDAIVIALQFHGTANDGFIEKLQALLLTGVTRRQDPDLACLEAIQPKPDGRG